MKRLHPRSRDILNLLRFVHEYSHEFCEIIFASRKIINIFSFFLLARLVYRNLGGIFRIEIENDERIYGEHIPRIIPLEIFFRCLDNAIRILMVGGKNKAV